MKKVFVLLTFLTTVILSGCGEGSNNQVDNMTGEQTEQTEQPAQQEQPTQPEEPEQTVENGTAIVDLPDNYTDQIIYTTVDRGNAHEKLYASPETIKAVQSGEPIPQGTVLTLEIYRDEILSDIFVMEKRLDWGDQPTEEQNGDWRFQAYNADQTLNTKRDVASCISCHASQERDDFTYTLDELKTFQLEDFTAAADLMNDTVLEEWKIKSLTNYLAKIPNTEDQM
ncbi:cytochrome P460 family protein [Candidatus Pristimantibacillus sp. PTI5]|uniref:cytochrome P460 family protein n=1 Tax=Candidatus Pristimantibacillus sp. PTI5 TaxID=3400422 RepID=UPI003B0296B9